MPPPQYDEYQRLLGGNRPTFIPDLFEVNRDTGDLLWTFGLADFDCIIRILPKMSSSKIKFSLLPLAKSKHLFELSKNSFEACTAGHQHVIDM